MLPSFNHTMPTGNETGTFLSLDVGGSTLRIAIVTLSGREIDKAESPMKITALQSWKIDNEVKNRKGKEFFDWMAQRIDEMLSVNGQELGRDPNHPLEVGLAWSFPIAQTSARSGTLQTMGKGFNACSGILNQDLANLIESSCAASNLSVRVQAIVNDGAATLLSRAYLDSSTRLALILGTGVNAAIYLPVSALGRSKFGRRPSGWYRQASHVVVNTEMSMFGKYVFPTTRWDEHLNATHVMPDFQPFEHLVSGRYLGEIFRLVLAEGVSVAGLFDGKLPHGMDIPYNLDTAIMAAIEADESPELHAARKAITEAFPFVQPPSLTDLRTIQQIARCISRRAAAYLAVGIHALWSLREETTSSFLSFPPSPTGSSSSLDDSPITSDCEGHGSSISRSAIINRPVTGDVVTIGCNGSVFEKYPRFALVAQAYLDDISSKQFARRLVLEPADESALFGAAVAVGIADTDHS